MDDENKNNEMDDLEAQLSSLGLFGSDDDPDPFGGLSFDEDDPFAALDALSNPQSAPPPPERKEVSLDDLDDILGEVEDVVEEEDVAEDIDLDELLGSEEPSEDIAEDVVLAEEPMEEPVEELTEAPSAEVEADDPEVIEAVDEANDIDDMSALDDLDDLLGGTPGVAEDPLADFEEPDLSGFEDLDSLMGGDGGGDFDDLDSLFSSAGGPMSNDGDAMDLDAQLNALLMADQAADETFEVKDISSAMPTQSVYDPEVDGMGSVQYVKGSISMEEEKPVKLFENMSSGKMVATFVVGVLLICVGAVTAILAHSAVQAQDSQIASLEHFVAIEIPEGTANDIFVHESAVVGGVSLSLTRISAGYSGTFVYFDEFFDPDDFYILMYNQARHLYARTTFGMSGSVDTGTVLRFGPLTFNTLFLTLHIQCKSSGEFALFSYRFLSPPVHDAPVFINRSINVAGRSERPSGINIGSAVFDSTSSAVHFNYTHGSAEEGFSLLVQDDVAVMSLNDLGGSIIPMTNENAIVYFEDFGIALGTSVFGPLFSLESNVGVIFNGLTYFYPNPTVGVMPEQLFGNDQNNPFLVETGEFTLNLEGMVQDGQYVILTFHGLNEANRRIATDADIALRIALDDGHIDIQGRTRVSPRGSDVIFDLQPYINRIRDVHISQYSLVINRIKYDVPSTRIPVRVSRFYNMKNTRRHMAETAVVEALNSLMSYKSGETSRAGVFGVSQDIINSPIGEMFAPADVNGVRPMFAASVSTGALVSNYDYLAIAEVQWTLGESSDLRYFRETFKVTARSRDGIWSIVGLEIL
ncbi:MAG: hypothetical protein FWF78_00380 [Defluviitaleaceae bacterium]|nr:hypothetical protein [Defluviitaleaceae bacterium]